MNTPVICPCGTGKDYSHCCGKYHHGDIPAPSAEALMRSRYSAYALCIMDYIIKTTHPSQQKAVRRELTSYNNDHVAWQKLTLIQTEKGKESDATGTVEFKAYYKEEGTEHIMHEVSRFSQIKQQWFYIHPNLPIQAEQQATVGRNDLCPCGSGRKYKKCCINS